MGAALRRRQQGSRPARFGQGDDRRRLARRAVGGPVRLFRRKRDEDDDQPVDLNDRSPELGLKYKDLMILDQLMKSGADLAASRHVIYYSYAPSKEVADGMRDEADAAGWTADAR